MAVSSMLDPSSNAQECSAKIVQMPGELWNLILGDLRLSDIFHLSQTCRALRRLGPLRWKDFISHDNITPAQRAEFFSQLSHVTTDSPWLSKSAICQTCGSLHHVDPKDIPHNQLSRKICSASEITEKPLLILRGASGEAIRDRPAAIYVLRQTHVQMAHRMHRLGAKVSVDKILLRNIMKPLHQQLYFGSVKDPWKLSSSVNCMLSMQSYNRKPGCHFLVRAEEVQTTRPLDWTDYRLCPHLWITPLVTSQGVLNNQFQALFSIVWDNCFRSNLPSAKMEAASSCNSCATDYHIVGDPVSNRIKLTVWRDFGEEMSSQDVRWKAQEIILATSHVSHRCRGGLVKGEVQRLWEENISQFQRMKTGENVKTSGQGGYYEGRLDETGGPTTI